MRGSLQSVPNQVPIAPGGSRLTQPCQSVRVLANPLEQLDRTALDDLVAWMRLRGVVVLETQDVKLALGPEPPKPAPPPVKLTAEEEHKRLWAEALEKAEDYARKQYAGTALSKPDLEKLATMLTGAQPCT